MDTVFCTSSVASSVHIDLLISQYFILVYHIAKDPDFNGNICSGLNGLLGSSDHNFSN